MHFFSSLLILIGAYLFCAYLYYNIVVMKKLWVLLLGVFVGIVFSLWSSEAAPQTTDVFLTLSGGEVTIGSIGSIDLGTFSVSSSVQNAEGAFADDFWVEDLKGADAGWYTTLSTTDMIHQGDNSTKITADNISVKAPTSITLLWGSTNPLVILDAAWSAYRSFSSAGNQLTFISRNTESVNNGLLGKYGVKPSIKVVIPAYQAVGSYKAVLTYTLFEN